MREFIFPTEIPEEIEFYEEFKCEELIRCKDCRHNPQNGAMPEELPYWFPCKNRQPEPDWFCADGERAD